MNMGKAVPALVMGLLVGTGVARGQQSAPPAAAAQTPPPAAGTTLSNPFLTPAMNPYLNPYLSTTSMSSDAALLYLLAAQRQSGGLGSGVISGVRQAETTARPARGAAVAPTAASPYGGDAGSRYFQRGQGRFGGRAGSYFQRTAPKTGR
jgi:hypothetical protein